MPVNTGTMQIANAELARFTGKTFTVEGLGVGQTPTIIPLTGSEGKAITTGHKLVLAKTAKNRGFGQGCRCQ